MTNIIFIQRNCQFGSSPNGILTFYLCVTILTVTNILVCVITGVNVINFKYVTSRTDFWALGYSYSQSEEPSWLYKQSNDQTYINETFKMASSESENSKIQGALSNFEHRRQQVIAHIRPHFTYCTWFQFV